MLRMDDSIFNGMDEAGADGGAAGGKLETPGTYRVKIDKAMLKPSENPAFRSAIYLIVECEVVTSNHEQVKPGDKGSFTKNIVEQFYGLPVLKNFLASALGYDLDSEEAVKIGKKESAELFGTDGEGPYVAEDLEGVLIDVTVTKAKRKSGEEYAKWVCAPVEA